MPRLKDLAPGDWVVRTIGDRATLQRVARRTEKGKIVVGSGLDADEFHGTGRAMYGPGTIRPATKEECRAAQLLEQIQRLKRLTDNEWIAMGEKRLKQIITLAGL